VILLTGRQHKFHGINIVTVMSYACLHFLTQSPPSAHQHIVTLAHNHGTVGECHASPSSSRLYCFPISLYGAIIVNIGGQNIFHLAVWFGSDFAHVRSELEGSDFPLSQQSC
jgi:hypothetical protein